MMTKSELFKAAHKAAHEYRAFFDSYRTAFSFALTEIYAMMKNTEKTVAEKLEALGINAWERGEMKRYYFNGNVAVAELAGFKCQTSGKWENDSERITSASMNAILCRGYFDAVTNEVVVKNAVGGFNFAAEKEAFCKALLSA